MLEMRYLLQWRICLPHDLYTICDRSIAPSAFSHAFEDITSTRADNRSREQELDMLQDRVAAVFARNELAGGGMF
jgi:hypothetical protein